MEKAAVIGAGNVGTSAALALARMNIAEVVVTDVLEGLAEGKALDIAQSARIHGFDVPVRGSSDASIIEGSSVVVVTAGRPRKPGMSRTDLLNANAEIVSKVAESISRHAPDTVIICITNPLDIMCYHMWRETGFPQGRVMGMAGVLDSARFALFLAMEAGCSPDDVSCMVLGGHGDSMVPLVSSAAVNGVPVRDLVDEAALRRAVERTRKAGAEIVGLLKTGSAFSSPGAAGAMMARAVLCDTGSTLPASAYLKGEYGFGDVFLGVPVQLGREGIRRVVEVSLSGDEKAALDSSYRAVKEGMAALAGE